MFKRKEDTKRIDFENEVKQEVIQTKDEEIPDEKQTDPYFTDGDLLAYAKTNLERAWDFIVEFQRRHNLIK